MRKNLLKERKKKFKSRENSPDFKRLMKNTITSTKKRP
jgi:hypothetical protein